MTEDLTRITNILEAALLTAGEPVSLTQLSKLFDPPLESDVIRKLLAELPPLAEFDTSPLLELPDAPAKAAEVELALASPLVDTPARESDDSITAAPDGRAQPPESLPTLH